MAQLAQRLGFNLADTLARHVVTVEKQDLHPRKANGSTGALRKPMNDRRFGVLTPYN
jgi:hypothetical protein